MSTSILTWFHDRAKKKRLDRYRLQLSLIGGHIYDSRKGPVYLSQFWQGVQISDLLGFTAKQRLSVQLELGHANLPELLEFIRIFNELMVVEDDTALEQYCHNKFMDLKLRVLEHYLSDDKHYEIDVAAVLTQLKSQLLIHCHTLENFDNQFYQRQASRFYLDLHRVTVQWVQVISGEEITPYVKPL